jgi:hypothetical protein
MSIVGADASLVASSAAAGVKPRTVPVTIADVSGFEFLAAANASSLYAFNQSDASVGYEHAPLLVKLVGSRHQIGYDYAALLGAQTSSTYNTFLGALTGNDTVAIAKLAKFIDYLWDSYYVDHIPKGFMTELEGMQTWCSDHAALCGSYETAPHVVSRRFYGLANMPADAPNIISALERELERGWPTWLRTLVNDVIKILEKFVHTCDAYGVWGSRTQTGRLYTSRNLDYNANTGINKYKLLQIYDIAEPGPNGAPRMKYSAFGFTFGLGALAGQSQVGITTSEMNLDNSQTTFSGLPFPLRLRYVMEKAHNLETAMGVWNATNNTNSFNFLLGSAADVAAYALETEFNFTAQFPADSPVEAAATYDCGYPPHEDPTCHKWVWNQTQGKVRIGYPLPEAVWRTNHGMSPVIMKTQEPLFNNTIFRYRVLHNLFAGYEAAGLEIGDDDAVGIVATVGIKGEDYFTCTGQKLDGDNVLSVAYVPGEQRAFVAWEDGSGASWRPASCATYYHVNLTSWWA